MHTNTHTNIHTYINPKTHYISTHVYKLTHTYTHKLCMDIYTHAHTRRYMQTRTHKVPVCVNTIYLTTLSTLKVSTNIDFICKRYLTDMLAHPTRYVEPLVSERCCNFFKKKKRFLSKASSHSFCVS